MPDNQRTVDDVIANPPDCPVCGARPRAEHAENCNVLAAIRGQEYPTLIDQNGAPWYMNVLREREAEITRLRSQVAQQGFMCEQIKGLRGCLGFFASVIKSGEPWTATCEEEYRKVKQQ